jgi:hypothetical protein
MPRMSRRWWRDLPSVTDGNVEGAKRVQQDRITHKTSTILVSTGGKLRSFRTLEEIPEQVRQRLIRSTSGPYSATLLIADEAGRQEVLRSLRGQPSAVESRWMRSFSSPSEPARPAQAEVGQRWRRVAEVALLAGIGLCLWLLAAWR